MADMEDNVIIIMVDVIMSLIDHIIHMLVVNQAMQPVLIGIHHYQQMLILKGNYSNEIQKKEILYIHSILFVENYLVYILLASISNFIMIFLLNHHIWIIHQSIQFVFQLFYSIDFTNCFFSSFHSLMIVILVKLLKIIYFYLIMVDQHQYNVMLYQLFYFDVT